MSERRQTAAGCYTTRMGSPLSPPSGQAARHSVRGAHTDQRVRNRTRRRWPGIGLELIYAGHQPACNCPKVTHRSEDDAAIGRFDDPSRGMVSVTRGGDFFDLVEYANHSAQYRRKTDVARSSAYAASRPRSMVVGIVSARFPYGSPIGVTPSTLPISVSTMAAVQYGAYVAA